MTEVPVGVVVFHRICVGYISIERMIFVVVLGPPMLWLFYRVYVPFFMLLFVKP